MPIRTLVLALAAVPTLLAAQQPADSNHQHGDSLTRAVYLKEITVTAAAARRDEPRSAVTISPAAISQTPALNTYDLIRQTGGIEVHDQGQGPGFASDASVRGFSSDHSADLALWIDGVPINEPVNGHAEGYNDWSLLMPQAVRSVDIYKGPTSALYGNFALAGVVNVRTLERMTGTQAELEGGSYGRLEGSVLTGFDRGATGGVFGLRGLRENGWRPNGGYHLGQGHARLVRELSPSTALDAGFELYGAGWDSPGFLTLDQYDRSLYDTVSNFTDGGFKRHAQERLSVRVLSGAGLIWRSTVYATQGRWQLFLTTPPEGGGEEGSGSQTEEEDRRYGFGATSALTWSAGRSDITAGVEGRWDHSDFANWFTTNRKRDSVQVLTVARQASGGLFLQSTSDVGPHLRVTLGGRYDVLATRTEPPGGPTTSKSKGVVSPKVGLLYHLPQAFDLYGNVSRGFRQTDGVIEDPTLPFITAWAYETGIKYDTRALSASVALFRMDVSNEQTFDPITLTSSSGGRSRRQGVELELRASLTPTLKLTGNWSFNDAKYRSLITEDGDTLSGARVFNTAKYLGASALAFTAPNARWRLRLSGNVVGPYTPFDEPDVRLSPYALLHASGEVFIGRAQLQLGIRNLLDHKYPELRAGGFVVPGQPISLFGTVKYLF